MSRFGRGTLALLVGSAACSGGGRAKPEAGASPPDAGVTIDGGAAETGPLPFAADPPAVYVAKVKNLLVGLAADGRRGRGRRGRSDAADALIAGWMQLPQYTQKMQRFFELAFQQTQVTSADFADQFYPKQIDVNGTTTPLLLQNLEESFARTMLALIAAGQPLTAATTTNQLMMTTALKELYAFLDVWQVDDNGKVTDRFKKANPKLQITVEAAAGPDPDRRDARPDQRQLHALVRPRRRHAPARRSPGAPWIRSSIPRAR